ncbi:MAG: hypothetical protein ABJM82_18185 [Shimia thalassica]|uniref:hypothetical protein n=1 Tax=Shimia thalassica TaxID=1715693 RepID=UPI00329721CC
MKPHPSQLQVVDSDDLPGYPFTSDDQLGAHFFIAWHHREWLNSAMRLKGTPESRAIYFDLICVAQDQKPVGTLPDDDEQLAKLAGVPESHFRALRALEYGPLHKWQRCLCGGEIRLFHPRVLEMVSDAVSRKETNRARVEAANNEKRLQRLRKVLTGYSADLAKNDAAILFMDEWLVERTSYRTASWVERAITAWSNHMFDKNRR